EECMEGTREDVLRTVLDWVTDSGAANIFWLKGHPGVGKSAIATSLVEELRGTRRLGSSFFFQREKSTSMTTDALWRTVAYDLARRYPTVRKHLIAALEADEALVTTANVEKLFRALIYNPFMACEEGDGENAPVVVIDALDECGGLHGQHSKHRINLMRTLKTWSMLPKRFKLVVTSRAESDIVHLFSAIQHGSFEILSGALVHLKSSKDIERFLEYHLGQIAARSQGALPPEWPGRHMIDWLTQTAAGLFIWVETAIRFLKRGEPQEQLNRILGGAGMGGLAALYSSILEASFVEPSEMVLESFSRIVGAIILAKEPLTASSLVHLCSVDHSTLSYIRNGLQSVMEPGEAVRFSHQSFVDFLIDSTKCRSGFFIEIRQQKRNITLGCFRVMKQHLQFNISNLKSSYKRNSEIADLEQRIKEWIPSHLIYSAYYWATHLSETIFDPELLLNTKNFMQDQFLFWLEVLSLTKRVNLGTSIMYQLIEWLGNGKQDDKMARDMKKFIAAFGSVISQSAPHIYLSALPFSPQESVVSKKYMKLYPRTIGIEKGGQKYWPVLQNVLEGHTSSTTSVAFSPDGMRIVSGSSDMTIRIWDAETAEMIAGPFWGHNNRVTSVAFSPDGARVVSGSHDQTVRVWDARTAKIVARPFEKHKSSVTSVAFSPDGTRVVSSSYDTTIWVWDAEAAKVVAGPFNGHTSVVSCVGFSPEGTMIVSGSHDKTIRVWNAKTAAMVAGPFEGHTDWVTSVAFSPDGTRVVSGSDDRSLRVWDAKTAEMIVAPFKGHTNWVTSVAFSPDGTRVVSGSHDQTVRVWDIKAAEVVAGPFKGHSHWVTSVAFSPDGTRVASGSDDMTIRVWDAETAEMTVSGPFEGHTHWVSSVAFSPDGTRAVSGSFDTTIRLWDVKTAEMVGKPFKGHTDWVSSVAFSPDGTCVASGSNDWTIRLWDAKAAKMITRPFKGHVNWVSSVAFSPNGMRIVSGSHDATIRVWDTRTAKTVAGPFRGHTNWVSSVAFSPDGTRIVSGSYDTTIRVWNVKTRQMVGGPFEGHSYWVSSVAFSPDGACVVSGSHDWTIRVWDVETSRMVASPFEGHINWVSSVAFSPDGTRVVSGSFDTTIRVWDVKTAEVIAGPFEGHTDAVSSVAFSLDGTRIVSGSIDTTIRVWDAEAAEIVAGPFERHPSQVGSAIFSPHETRADSSSQPGKNRLWDTTASSFLTSGSSLCSFTDHSKLVDGWILGPDSEPLFWVPSEIRNGLFRPSTISVIGERLVTKLNLEHFVHGEAWVHCMDPLPNPAVQSPNSAALVPNPSGYAKWRVPLEGHEEIQDASVPINKRARISKRARPAKRLSERSVRGE
ncbi:hypothetical protein M408DRAFT_83055, partial [Serendipita vermifera MAFF 305830]